MTRLAYHYARRAAGRIAEKRHLTRDQTRQVCCLATLAIHHGAELRDAVAAARRLATTLSTETNAMIERQQPFNRRVRPCADCQQMPRLFRRLGSRLLFIECGPCQQRTEPAADIDAVIDAWNRGDAAPILCTRLSAAAA